MKFFSKIVCLFLLILFANSCLAKDSDPVSVWDEIPDSMSGRYEYFKKQDVSGVVKRYEKKPGTKLLFACVTAYGFRLASIATDTISSLKEAEAIVEQEDCLIDKEMRFYGTPILIDFHLDENANIGYAKTKEDWVQLNDEARWFVYKKNIDTGNKNIKASWVLLNASSNETRNASYKYIEEFDCGEMRSKVRDVYAYPYRYGMGRPEELNLDSDWKSIIPGSDREALAELICNRK